MERLTMVSPAPGEPPAPGWRGESWREYATASVEHIDLRPAVTVPRPVTMDDLTHGTRVRHIAWNETGTIRVLDGVTEIRWDDIFGEIGVSPEGPVFPSDLEIIPDLTPAGGA